MKQNYEAYTTEDLSVWTILYDRQMEHLKTHACREYLEAQKHVAFRRDRIPHFDELNQILDDATGFGLTAVPNIQPNEIFFPALAHKRFTATTWLRKMSELDYISEPDMFHDVFGHVPLLSHKVFADFFHHFGMLGVKYLDHPEAITMLGRVYWFTVEFGLLEEKGEIKIFGAGLISSHGESKHCLSEKVVRKPFNIEEIMHQDFNNAVMQDLYFVLPNFETLLHSLPQIELVISNNIKH
jgi:phenylalanine-4-hydroxylase